jgi:hypothetical protein
MKVYYTQHKNVCCIEPRTTTTIVLSTEDFENFFHKLCEVALNVIQFFYCKVSETNTINVLEIRLTKLLLNSIKVS